MERIDTHSHAIPARWRQHCMDLGYGDTDGISMVQGWTVEAHLATMDNAKISKSILSITSPGTHLKPGDDAFARRLTRETNEDLADICAAHPDRFAFFASLPLPDIEGSLAEIDHALDHLGAVGFSVMTNAHAVYLGDPALDRVFEKLNSRRAVVFMHPTCCRVNLPVANGVAPQAVAPLTQYPRPMLEFLFDTTRAVSNLILSGTVARYQSITFVVPHCGAALPPVIERCVGYMPRTVSPSLPITSDDVKHLFKTRFFFDLAGYPFPDQIHGLLRFTEPSRLLYGTDYPFYKAEAVYRLGGIMEQRALEIFNDETRKGIFGANARRLLWPKLKNHA
ncbi:uncharacterized protein A1O5_01783 [Cladophialophora psammophila CBS 110553]|uniref:6-methylsalicylate decarboxylase n=1 Tax=Cladophialophora psammophila CBS 110553 TaxID=1182543 RepID=W9X3M4_9EURO|nr:uncharacterized protein A1O5_01783 [Cladophialophora psammophila CBS 110553]EXJ75087.1 hypothetical protein A1O5_01783 [Cladophialophora psammophila CBS 110553]